MKLAFLFGAGASYGAGRVQPETPPLGRELYDRLRVAFPETWGSVILPSEDEAFRWDDPPFEQGMEMLWEANDERVQLLVTDLALYFCRFSLSSTANAYSRLLSSLSGKSCAAAFATLNYDCLLESALELAGSSPNYLLQGGPRGNVVVMKPHGSCNFVMSGLGSNIQIINSTMAGMGRAYYEGPLMAIPPRDVAALYAQGPSMPPAVSLYSPGKRSLVAPGEIDRIREHWRETAKQADVVIVVGARPNLEDAHVWTPVLESTADVWHIAGTGGSDFEEYQSTLGRRFWKLGDTFDGALSSLEVRLRIVA